MNRTVQRAAPRVIEAFKQQLDAGGLPDYIEVARGMGHGLNIVLFLLPDGKLGSPRVSIDTRGDKR